MTEVEARATSNQLRLANERQYVDTNFCDVNETLTSLTHHIKIMDKTTEIWNCMQQVLNTINTKITMVCNAQMAL